jgi:hypothetical protein
LSNIPKRRPVVLLLSVDKQQTASLVVDARGRTAGNLALLKEKLPNMAVVPLALPPCTAYSKEHTTGIRDPVGADGPVDVVRVCHEQLRAVCTVMENPAAPSPLPLQEVAGFPEPACEVNYRAHGGMLFKKTQLWSGPARFNLLAHGFQPHLCAGQGVCPIMLWDAFEKQWVHPQWVGTSLLDRQSIPPQLSRSIGGANGSVAAACLNFKKIAVF